jgi:hypothetical protein
MFKYLLSNNAKTIPKQLSILEALNEDIGYIPFF